MYVDRHEREHKVKPEYELKTFYGRLDHLFVVRFNDPESKLTKMQPGLAAGSGLEGIENVYILAAIRRCILGEHTSADLESLDIHLYSKMGTLDVLDVTAVQCLVGRVPATPAGWALIDRSGVLARAVPESTLSGDDSNNIDDGT